ncbi:MAG: ABC transporter substrate-binding protein [Zoogloea sp.]|nr:ABC transporter substrate-binding protein [Zoogloea sp.]
MKPRYAPHATRRSFLRSALTLAAGSLLTAPAARASVRPVLIGLDAELRDATSTSDDAIQAGIRFAIEDINSAGGVLGGRPLDLVVRDNHTVPARGIDNVREFAAMPELAAFFCGKFSPVALEQISVIHQLGLPMLDPWAAADGIVDNGQQPNYVFRLSLRDTWAIRAFFRHARSRGLERIGLLLPNTGWGRSSHAAAKKLAQAPGAVSLVASEWYNWGDKSLTEQYARLRKSHAQAVILVANEVEGSLLVHQLSALPAAQRLPIFSHWGITGGRFAGLCGPALAQVDLAVVQTYSFSQPRNELARRLAERATQAFGVDHPAMIPSAVGLAHAYDLTRLLAFAIDRAGSTDRERIRDALERLPSWEGVIRRYAPAFTSTRHEALSEQEVFMAHYTSGQRLERITGHH